MLHGYFDKSSRYPYQIIFDTWILDGFLLDTPMTYMNIYNASQMHKRGIRDVFGTKKLKS